MISKKMLRFVDRVTAGQRHEEHLVCSGVCPGSELRRLLSRHGFNPDLAGCQCAARAAEMDRHGPDWCERNLEMIVDWMQEESHRRGVIFFAWYARFLVRRAIRAARRKEEVVATLPQAKAGG